MTIEKGELVISVEKKSKNKFHLLGTTTYFTDCFYLWRMLERRLCVLNAGLKVDASREILTVIMMSYYEKVCSCKRHTVVHRAFYFWRFALLFILALRLTTVSLDQATVRTCTPMWLPYYLFKTWLRLCNKY